MTRRRKATVTDEVTRAEVLEDVVSEVEAVEVTPEPTPPPAPQRDPNAVSLRIYITAGGRRYEHTAGFQNYAARKGLGPMSIREWRAEEARFQKLPVK